MRLIAGGGGPPSVCYCGCTTWRHDLTTFPLRHVSRCEGCGREVVCEMKATPPKPPPEPYPPMWLY